MTPADKRELVRQLQLETGCTSISELVRWLQSHGVSVTYTNLRRWLLRGEHPLTVLFYHLSKAGANDTDKRGKIKRE